MPENETDSEPNSNPKQLTLDRHFQRREEFELAVSMLDMADREKKFIQTLYDISADHALREKLSTADLPCEVRRDRHTIWVICDQSALAATLGYSDARTIRKILMTLAESDPEERLFQKRKLSAKGRQQTVYMLSLDELHSLTQIDPDSILYIAIETFGANPFAPKVSNPTNEDCQNFEIDDNSESGDGAGGESGGRAGGESASDVITDEIDVDVSSLKTSSVNDASGADLRGIAQVQARCRANMAVDAGPATLQMPVTKKSFAAIDDTDVRRIANFAVDGVSASIATRRALLEAYFLDAVKAGVASPSDKVMFTQAFMLAGRAELKTRGPWLRKVWENAKAGRPLQLVPRDREQAALLLQADANDKPPPR
jgi:hypothetical protein